MNDRTRIVSDEEFAAAVVDRASDLAYEGQGDLEILKVWARLCAVPEPEDVGPVFWEGFVLGGAVVGLEIAGLGARLRDKPSGPVLKLIRGGKDTVTLRPCFLGPVYGGLPQTLPPWPDASGMRGGSKKPP